ncbi:hypothetical protein [Nocardia sp. NPDC056000]|uniref:hypothetical protein n=1 Tax=Nocardia sp. NPDC056000 TaxID=3345674 RepID=UPI0035DBBF29
MRADFAARTREYWKPLHRNTALDKLAEIGSRAAEYDRRWQSGPYSEEWEFLRSAYADRRDYPDAMRDARTSIEASSDVVNEYGITELSQRSLIQARELADERIAMTAKHMSQRSNSIQRER